MMRKHVLFSTLSMALLQGARAKLCFMLYQMADNNLEYYIRQDYQELSSSAFVRSTDAKTWVYHDAYGGQPLPSTVDSVGRSIPGNSGSSYVTYDHSLGRMRLDTTLSGEQNSDTEAAVLNFLTHAMTDCLANGYDSLMAVFSSHGGGFAGYGGDENVRARHRSLLQPNRQVASAIRGALSSVSGAPDKLDVIGFDACLMQALGAADDYMDVAQYMLASEAVEPGHGWAYAYWTSASDSVSLAGQVVSTYLSQTQGGGHQSPKVLSLISFEAYSTFVAQLEGFAAVLLERIQTDQTLHAFVSRARASTVAFEGIVDTVGTHQPSAMDIGSFLNAFAQMCNPSESSDLGSALTALRTAYSDMMVAHGVGPGTAAGTGMHVTWPPQGEYQRNRALWDTILFTNRHYATNSAPNFQAFLEYFLSAATPGSSAGDSVCQVAAQPAGQPVNPSELLSRPEANIESTKVTLTAHMAPRVDQVVVEYAVDLSSPLKPFLEDRGYIPSDIEYLYLKGGDVRGSYQGNTFEAEWNRDFYFLNITGQSKFEAIYVQDQGDGSKAVPVMYFPESQREAASAMQFLDFLFFDFEFWVEQGARYGFLTFSVDQTTGEVDNNLILFTSDVGGTAFAEKSRSDGGLIIPLIYVHAFIQDRKIDTLPGGFNQTIIEWREDLDYHVIARKADVIFDVIPSTDAVVATMYGFDFGESDSALEAEFFDIIRPDRGGFADIDIATDSSSGMLKTLFALGVAAIFCVLHL
ncbi:peptidase C11, clostripain [Seminavis robusta]|uniref:Peptidase C11, clostripain n=1 Tax=Seminavis robusta TaxID=568900 RepID=A0A9N8ERW5_9STRA|nr:peptidase C11, clostripain [Seminavis robusta]|eukprot:Sro1608_g285670.1 peptidase C11, clostripain (749) ;mRNA; r:8615-11209